MKRALARLNGDDRARRAVGQRYSEVNRTRVQNRLQEQAAQGLVPMRPDEVDAARKQQASTYKTNSQRGINVPRVGLGPRYERPPAVLFVPHRRTGEEIREANDNFEPGPLPAYVPTQSSEERKDDLAMRNQFSGKTPQEIISLKLAAAQKELADARRGGGGGRAAQEATPGELRNQIADEVAERQEFLDTMVAAGKGAEYEAEINGQIAERLADLRRLDALEKND